MLLDCQKEQSYECSFHQQETKDLRKYLEVPTMHRMLRLGCPAGQSKQGHHEHPQYNQVVYHRHSVAFRICNVACIAVELLCQHLHYPHPPSHTVRWTHYSLNEAKAGSCFTKFMSTGKRNRHTRVMQTKHKSIHYHQ